MDTKVLFIYLYLILFLLEEKNTLQVLGCQRLCSPDDHDDAVEDVVGVLDVAKGPVDQNLQQHLQGEEAGENDVTDLQRIGQLIRLETVTEREEWLVSSCWQKAFLPKHQNFSLVFFPFINLVNVGG